MKSRKLALAAAVLATAGAATAHAAAGDILVRVRALGVVPDVSSNKTLKMVDTDVTSTLVPELDLTYMFTNNIGAELVLGTTRNNVDVNLGGKMGLGRVSLLPPTLTLQWHFNPQGTLRPYVGAGINYTIFYNNDLKLGGEKVKIDSGSFGPALQAGVDVAINKDWFVNFDVKKVWISTKAKVGGAGLGTLHIDPWLIGVGVGRRF